MRFWSKVDVKPGKACWNWNAVANKNTEQGRFYYNGKMRLAYRVSWELVFGDISHGLVVRHKCDNPRCVRPTHLLLGTHADNTQDMVSRGRQWQQKKTRCKHGHDTWVITKRGRKCTTCAVARTKAWRHSSRKVRNG